MAHFSNIGRAFAGLGAMAAIAAAQPVMAQNDQAEADTQMSKGEQRLAEMLEGRVAGEPVNCIRQRLNARMTTIDKTAYVYGSGNTIYVQRTQSPERIDDRDALVLRRFNATQLCRQDTATKIDPVFGFFTGAVFFDDFIPYTRVSED